MPRAGTSAELGLETPFQWRRGEEAAMAEEKPQTPFGDMVALWQKMIWEGFETMLKAPTFAAGVGKAVESSATLQDQIQKSIQASLKAMQLPSADDLRRIAEGFSTMQAQLDAMKSYLGAVEAATRVQGQWRKGMDETIQRLLAYQSEGQKTLEGWTKHVEERLQSLQHLWEEGAKRWEEGLHQAAAFAQTSQRSLEELNKSVWDMSKKVFGGP